MIPSLWQLVSYSLSSLKIDIIWGYQNAPRVEKPYAMITYTTGRLPDHENYGAITENGLRINSSWRRAVVTLQFFCGQSNSYSYASKAASLLASASSIDKQVSLDVSIGHRLFLQHVPALLNESQYEDRAIYQFEFYYTENVPDDIGRIETIIITGGYGNAAGENLTPLVCREVVSTRDVYVDEARVRKDN